MPDYTASVDIMATPEQVFDFLVTAEGLTAWMGQHAVIEPVPGGVFEVDIAGSMVRGRCLEVDRPHRVVVSWGMSGSADLPPGASRVSFELSATTFGTRLDLTHSELPEPSLPGHADGWHHFLDRLALRAGGVDLPDDDWVPLDRR